MQYSELFCKTHYSFLTGASHPHELVERASELGLTALGITDQNGVYGLPKTFLAIKDQKGNSKLRMLSGCSLTLEGHQARVRILAPTRASYGVMCRLITASFPRGKENPALSFEKWSEILNQYPAGRDLLVFPEEDFGHPKTESGKTFSIDDFYERFQDRLYFPLSRRLDGLDARRTELALERSRRYGRPIVAVNDVVYARPENRVLQDTITAIRHGVTLREAGTKLFQNGERYLKSPAQMARLFQDLPDAISKTLEITDRCPFQLSELRYRYPSEWIPQGRTAQGYLQDLTWAGARVRYPGGIPSDVEKQLHHELKLVSELGFADYFLTIWEIVSFAREKKILCQGRGSAANSIVCYCLGITAIDPVRMNLLFERFISAERGEPPDIDVDFEADRREEVIQHIYQKYGRDRAGMVSAVITYRSKLAIRETTKVLEVDLESAKSVRRALRENKPIPEEFQSPKLKLAARISEELYGMPRHLSIHSGGFTLSADPLIETVPVEPARMEGRTIVQWDKYDLDAVGLLKVDVLSLGMLTAIQKTLESIPGKPELYQLPADDPATYAMIQRADTVGVFQIESRAQMGMLPRLKPKTFYDLVVQVAIVRPGPIVGKMVHPYLKRRRGEEAIDLPHPALGPILGKTLGVPLFQEQVMKMAVTLAGFTPGEADELRRAIGAWRSSGSIEKLGHRLMAGLLKSGLSQEFVDRIFAQIQGFAEYGFPESHAASFALLAYASSYLKCHYPAEFLCALINSQPMGFYSNHSLVDDAKRHGVKVLPVHPNQSLWDCTLEAGDPNSKSPAVRLGFRVVKGMSKSEAESLVQERKRNGIFQNLSDFVARSGLRRPQLLSLAMGDALHVFPSSDGQARDRRHTLWAVLGMATSKGSEETGDLLSGIEPGTQIPLFDKLDDYQAIRQDYRVFGLSVMGHPMQVIRQMNSRVPKLTTRDAKNRPQGTNLSIAGLSIVRQRPQTAKGTSFATLEDETGFLDLILHPQIFEKYEELYWHHPLLKVTGRIQRDGASVSLIVRRLEAV
ncbi:MAG: error-prone DNA polymerase [Bdellovibrionales bacterium]|nr:error-prone DNA polymerase [Bdellovibrionales bacterium]